MPAAGMPMTGLKSALPQQGGPALNNVVKAPFGQLPSPGGASSVSGQGGNAQLKLLGDLYNEISKKAARTQDPNLKAHFAAEANALKSLVQQAAAGNGQGSAQATPGAASCAQPGGAQQAGAPQQAQQAQQPPQAQQAQAPAQQQQPQQPQQQAAPQPGDGQSAGNGSPAAGQSGQPDQSAQGGQGQDGGAGQVKQAFSDLYQETMQKAAQTQDPQLKQHFQAEAQVIKATLDALSANGGGQAGPGAADPGAAAPQTNTDTAA